VRCYYAALVVSQKATELVHHARLGLDAFGLQRALEIGEHGGTEGRVSLGAGDELVEPSTCRG